MAERRVDLTPQVARTLRDLRIKAKLSQYDLAEKTGLTRPKIKRIEKREIATMAGADYDAIVRVLGPTKDRKSQRHGSNGKPPRAKRDKTIQAEVDRRLRGSVLTVMRDMIGSGVRTLMEKHALQDVTLGELFGSDE